MTRQKFMSALIAFLKPVGVRDQNRSRSRSPQSEIEQEHVQTMQLYISMFNPCVW